MLTEEKINEVRRLLSRGVPEGELKNQLQQEGYSEEEIKKIFAPRPYDMRNWLLICATSLFVVGVLVMAYYKSLLLLVFSVALFAAYYREESRLKREKAKEQEEA